MTIQKDTCLSCFLQKLFGFSIEQASLVFQLYLHLLVSFFASCCVPFHLSPASNCKRGCSFVFQLDHKIVCSCWLLSGIICVLTWSSVQPRCKWLWKQAGLRAQQQNCHFRFRICAALACLVGTTHLPWCLCLFCRL